jgi:glc operon protein GlcG
MLQSLALPLDHVERVAAAARGERRRMAERSFIAVVDDGGRLVYLERLDGTQTASSRIAEKK